MVTKSGEMRRKPTVAPGVQHWQLRLYVANDEPRGVTALTNLKRMCDQHVSGKYRIQVVDVLKHPQRCQEDQIVAIPTVVRRLPLPEKRLIGTLSSAEGVVAVLELRAAG